MATTDQVTVETVLKQAIEACRPAGEKSTVTTSLDGPALTIMVARGTEAPRWFLVSVLAVLLAGQPQAGVGRAFGAARGCSKITSMFALAASRFSVRAFEFCRRGEKKRSCASHKIQTDFTTELAL